MNIGVEGDVAIERRYPHVLHRYQLDIGREVGAVISMFERVEDGRRAKRIGDIVNAERAGQQHDVAVDHVSDRRVLTERLRRSAW